MSAADYLEAKWKIEDACLDANHAVRYTIVEDRAVLVVCSQCKDKIIELEEKNEKGI